MRLGSFVKRSLSSYDRALTAESNSGVLMNGVEIERLELVELVDQASILFENTTVNREISLGIASPCCVRRCNLLAHSKVFGFKNGKMARKCDVICSIASNDGIADRC